MRITREMMFMDFAEAAAKRSTCYRGNTGAIIVRANNPIAMGYNGAPPGEEHCLGNQCPLHEQKGGCVKSIHAEENAITRALGKNETLSLCHLYCTSMPCRDCADLIDHYGIETVFFRYDYRSNEGILKLLLNPARKVFRLTPAGILVDQRTGQIVE